MGGAITAAIFLLVAATIAALVGEVAHNSSVVEAVIDEWRKPITGALIRFTLWQAALSTLLSVVLAIPLARALARRRFRGREFLIRAAGLAFVIPSIVAVLGIVAVHGRSGWVNDLLALSNIARIDYLYGIGGILIAHVFFNLPLATRIFLNALLGAPQHHWRLATIYGMTSRHIFRAIEWPILRGMIAGVGGMIFLLCFTSFAIVLTLGGGPQSATLEVAIYQAVRFDFDLSRAVALSLIQIGICLILAAIFFSGGSSLPLRAGDIPAARPDRPDGMTIGARITDGAIIFTSAAFLIAPLLAVLLKTTTAPLAWTIITEPTFRRALGWSLFIAPCAGILSCAFALSICNAIVNLRRQHRIAAFAAVPEVVGMLTLLVPPITLGTGLFLLAHRAFGGFVSLGALPVILLNALLTLAFAIRILLPPLQAARNRYDPLCASLGIRGWHRWRILSPAMRRSAGYALAVAAALSAGDMGVIALFGTDDLATLPLLIYRLIGAYRLEQAAVAAVALCALCLALFYFFECIGRRANA